MDLRRRLLSFLNNDVDLAGSKMRRDDGRGLCKFQMFMCKVRDVHMSGWIRVISLAIFMQCNDCLCRNIMEGV